MEESGAAVYNGAMTDTRRKVSCPACGTTNFYPENPQGKKVACGRCKGSLPEPGTVIAPSADGLWNLVRKSSLPVLIDFFSPTCGPCAMMHPIVERVAKRRAGEIVTVRLDVDSAPEIASAFRVTAVPTFVVASQGTERARTSGAMSEMDFSLWLASQT